MKIYNTRQIKRLYINFNKLTEDEIGNYSILSVEAISYLLQLNPGLEVGSLLEMIYILNVSGEYLHRNNLYEDTKIRILEDGNVEVYNKDKWETVNSAYYTFQKE